MKISLLYELMLKMLPIVNCINKIEAIFKDMLIHKGKPWNKEQSVKRMAQRK